ncbi:MAG: hypothetical protein IK050_01000, partial [Lachnospiraceae bacterium]|nr:hypothetical protein [Lachnospiraceae bacterium]
MVTDNNPSLLMTLVLIIVLGIVIYEVISIVLLKKRQENLEEAKSMIKERHTKIVNYQIQKEREDA